MNKKISFIILGLIVTGAAAYYYFKPTAPAIISAISDIERKNRDALAAQLAQKHSQIVTKDIVTTIDLGEIESKLHKAFTYDTNAPNNARLNALEIYSGISSTAENSQVVNDILTANIKFDLANKAPGSLEYFIATSMTGNKEGIQNLMPGVLKALNENKNNPKLAIDMNDFVGRMAVYLQVSKLQPTSTILENFTPQNYQEMIDFFEKNPIDTSKFNPDTDVFYASANYQMTLNQLKYGKDNWVKPYIEILKKEENTEKVANLIFRLRAEDNEYMQLDNTIKQEKKEILLKEKANLEVTYTKDVLNTNARLLIINI
jgi:hypothetical protein